MIFLTKKKCLGDTLHNEYIYLVNTKWLDNSTYSVESNLLEALGLGLELGVRVRVRKT